MDSELSLPNFEFVRRLFHLSVHDSSIERSKLLGEICDEIKLCKATELSKFLRLPAECGSVCDSVDKEANDKELEALTKKVSETEESFGDVEIKNALLAKAYYFIRVGDKANAVETLDFAYKKTVGVGLRIDNSLLVSRLGYFFDDVPLARLHIEKAMVELEKGGDWERRNKLNIYRGLLALNRRDFAEAAKFLVDGLATFTCTELLNMREFVFYAVITAMSVFDRNSLKQKVLNTPEVLSVIGEVEGLRELLFSFYESRYAEFFKSLITVMSQIRKDRYLARHLQFITRTLRINAYRQYLTSFKSVKLDTMAKAFGVSCAFLDKEISGFVNGKQLNCKVDRVSGVVESKITDQRNEFYLKILKQGDLLLNRMQKLSRVIDM